MARLFYSDQERDSILSSVAKARKGRKKWNEVHAIAASNGFRGGLPALRIFVNKSRIRALKLPNAKVASAPVGKKKPQGELEDVIDRVVQERVRAALEKAIEALRSAM